MKKLLILAAVLAALSLSGCESAQASPAPEPIPSEFAYTQGPVAFFAPKGEEYSAKNGFLTEYDGIRYTFAATISEADRNRAVSETAAVMACLEKRFGGLAGDYSVCVWGYDYPARVEGNTLHIGCENIGTQDFAIGVAQMVFGNGTNYGILYGLGTDMARELGYPTEEIGVTLAEALTLYDTEPVFLDLNYACFLDAYADAETLPRVKRMALDFYDFLVREGKMELFPKYSDETYCVYLSQFLAANGKGEYDNADLQGTFFYNGGEQVRLVWENEYAVFYVREDFKAIDGAADLVNSGYAALRQLAADSALQAAQMEEYLGRFDTEKEEKADVVFTADKRYLYGSYAAARCLYGEGDPEQEIQMYGTDAFLHEYGHYLLRNTGVELWLNEAVCHYYAFKPFDGRLSYEWYADMTRTEALDPEKAEDAEEYALVQAIKEHIGHEFDWTNEDDYFWLNGAYIVAWDMFDQVTAGSHICAQSTFMYYLVQQAGEEAAVDAAVNGTPEETFGMTWNELVTDWEAYLKEEYAWVVE